MEKKKNVIYSSSKSGFSNYLDGLRQRLYATDIHVITVKPRDSESSQFNIITKNSIVDSTSIENVSCLRQEPYLSNENVVIVNLLVTKRDLHKFGKIEERIPIGFTPENISSKNAIFVYNSNSHVVKFMWMNLPDVPQFVVSYKLIPEKKVPERVLTITGTFTYAEDRASKTLNTTEENIEIEKFR